MKFKSILVNRNTTAAGIAMILMAITAVFSAAFDGNLSTVPDYHLAIAEIAAGIGLILARDGDKTSEQSGAINKKGV